MSPRAQRLLVITGAFLCVPALLPALDLSVGAKVGITNPWFSGSGYESYRSSLSLHTEPDMGVCTGLFVTLGLVGFLAVQPEVFYTQLGGRSGDSSYVWDDRADGVDLDLLVKLRLLTKRFQLCPFFGPEVFLGLGSNDIRVLPRNGDPSAVIATWQKEQLRIGVFGLVAGIGIEVAVRSLVWSLDARYAGALYSRFNDASGLADWRQHSVQVTLGVAAILAGELPGSAPAR